MAGFVDAQEAMSVLLDPYGTVASRPEPGMENSLPYIVVGPPTGPRDNMNWVARIEVRVFADTRAHAFALSEDIYEFLTEHQPHFPFDRITAATGPHEDIWPDDSVRVFSATYEIATRRR